MMAARQRLGRLLPLALGLLALVIGPGTASADEGTVRLRDGGVVSGTIEIYEPGRRVVLRTASGEVVTVTNEQIAELHVTPTTAQASTGSTPPPPPPPGAPYAQPEPLAPSPQPAPYDVVAAGPGAPQAWAPPDPAQQPFRLRLRLPSLAAPAVMMILGASLLGGGLWVLTHNDCSGTGSAAEDRCDTQRRSGFVLLSIGAPLAFFGLVVVLPIQAGKRARRRAAYARQLSLSPAVDPVGGRYGLAGTLRF
ncbi:MAG: hypothetical protein IPL19_27900 [Sandaracinaceae bacterium]|nr:hypothetical protein [Sandaracinaceae bacterium]